MKRINSFEIFINEAKKETKKLIDLVDWWEIGDLIDPLIEEVDDSDDDRKLYNFMVKEFGFKTGTRDSFRVSDIPNIREVSLAEWPIGAQECILNWLVKYDFVDSKGDLTVDHLTLDNLKFSKNKKLKSAAQIGVFDK